MEAILQQAQSGDRTAFGLLVKRYESMVYSLACHFLRNGALAEELSQDVFLHLYRSLSDIESEAHLVRWLRKTTTHRCVDQSRRLRIRPSVYLADTPEPAARDREADPFLGDLLRRMVRALPERARAVVLLRYQEDLEPAEIAEVMNMPVGTVKSSLHRALASLRTRLERHAVKGVSQ